ncbi:MAG: hypothetical protein HC857_15725 [Synechococcales cyanobacterium RU_4_20]|nr:hypothetical protein [Synechococcales cyanobacterium RU_4_20]NJR69791.1 hypothetical protein [Synechococcales cyanobacterium CRU_2_2]
MGKVALLLGILVPHAWSARKEKKAGLKFRGNLRSPPQTSRKIAVRY